MLIRETKVFLTRGSIKGHLRQGFVIIPFVVYVLEQMSVIEKVGNQTGGITWIGDKQIMS